MFGKDLTEIVVAVIIFVISGTDFYKGVLMVTTKQTPLLFMAQISFWILKLLPESIRESRYQKAMSVYIKRRRFNRVYAIAGGFLGILLSVLIFLNA